MEKQRYAEDLAAEVIEDFRRRQSARRGYETQWQLNTNFLLGNQYCTIGGGGEIEEEEKDYFWQQREVYNHIASIVETRLAKLGRIRPMMSVRPASGDEDDIKAGKVSTKILSSVSRALDMTGIIRRAAMWSELTGSVFYKPVWDENAGNLVGEVNGVPVYEGDVRVDVCPSYEVFPDDLTADGVDGCHSIIHARAMHVDDIFRTWGIRVKPEVLELYSIGCAAVSGSFGARSTVPKADRQSSENCATVIERYTRPTIEMPDGEFVIVAGGTIVHYGPLPFLCGAYGEGTLPFIKQDAIAAAGCFYGVSIIERVIPVQRAFNAVKNRKHEFMNRISMGVLAVEDGSVDMSNLSDEGLSSGKILVYRQGATPPRFMDGGSVPYDFSYEEDKLLSEFISISGVSELMRSSSIPSGISSGTALQLLIDQDDTRLTVTAENIRGAVKELARFILRLYRQFASHPRLVRFVGENGDVELMSFTAGDISGDDVEFDTENELSGQTASKQSMLFELLKTGLLSDENGRMSEPMRQKVLEVLGYGGWEQVTEIAELHNKKAQKENADSNLSAPKVSEIDDHTMHIAEHTRYMLSAEFLKESEKTPSLEQRMLRHIREHKKFLSVEDEIAGGNKNG